MVLLGSPGNKCQKQGFRWNIFTVNLFYNSYFQGTLDERYFLENIEETYFLRISFREERPPVEICAIKLVLQSLPGDNFNK
jgi:hypothetical protein